MNAMAERIVALAALAGFVLFVGVLIWFVREMDLLIVIIIGVALAGYDFFRTLTKKPETGD